MSEREPLTAQERELADRLTVWKTGAPPPAVEQAVLAQARSATAAVAAPRSRRPPWLVSLASAAVLVVAVGVVWRVVEMPGHEERLLESMPTGAPPSPEAGARGSDAPGFAPAEVGASGAEGEGAVRDAEPPAARTGTWEKAGEERIRNQADARPSVDTAPARFEQAAPRSDTPAKKEAPAGGTRARSLRAPQPAQGSSAPTPATPVPPPATAPVAAEPSPASSAPGRSGQIAPQAASPATPAARSVSPPSGILPAPAPVVERAPVPDTSSGIPDAREAGTDAGKASAESAGGADQGEVARDIARVRELVRQGRRAEAVRELEKLRRRFPQATLPDDLQALLAERRR